MKHRDAVSEYSRQRANDIMRAYFALIKSVSHISMANVSHLIANMTAPRFYVSESRASIIIGHMLKGHDLSYMKESKREMFSEIFRRFKTEYQHNPNRPISHIVGEIIEQPAPKFYLSPNSVRLIIIKSKKEWHKERQKRLFHCY